MMDRLVRAIEDDRGQDLVEYALLSGIIGILGALVFPQILEKMGDAYADSISETYGDGGVWQPCPPLPDSCP